MGGFGVDVFKNNATFLTSLCKDRTNDCENSQSSGVQQENMFKLEAARLSVSFPLQISTHIQESPSVLLAHTRATCSWGTDHFPPISTF